ncbi:MAG: homogentisate 1,2-dioxygenase [Candidatus Dormiibacterota bacterium]
MFPQSRGRFSRQAHCDLPEGTYEEEFGRQGFFGPASHLYHAHAPTEWLRIEGPLRPRAYDLRRVDAADAQDPRAALTPVLGNEDLRIKLSRRTEAMPYAYRNADADLIYFVHRGSGEMTTDFGTLLYEQGDYLVLPRGTTHRIFPKGEESFLLVIASTEMPELPPADRMGQHSPYDRAVLRLPDLPLHGGPPNAAGEWELVIEREGQWTRVFYPFDPIDTVGWKGDLSAFALNVKDIRPITSGRFHLPPSVHTTLKTSGFVLCTFTPRRIEGIDDEGAVRLPFYHRNIDYDEVLFYHAGQFMSRAGIDAGMMTWHPQGIHHGPQPKAIERDRQQTKSHHDEVAVMIDAVHPLHPLAGAEQAEILEYAESWMPQIDDD